MKNFKFDKKYVIGVTLKHMIRAVDISLDKTAQRIEDLDVDEGLEVLSTVSELHALRRSIVEYKERLEL